MIKPHSHVRMAEAVCCLLASSYAAPHNWHAILHAQASLNHYVSHDGTE
jgi:hypothetical protein